MDKGANPFLFAEDEYESPPCAVSNPFLMADDSDLEPATNDNPFLSQTAVTMVATTTNPFAFDPMDLGPAEAQPAIDFTSTTQLGYTTNYTNAFMNIVDDFQSEPAAVEPTVAYVPEPANVRVTSPPQKPTELHLMYTNSVNTGDYNMGAMGVRNGGPGRPPPPRPPPSKETQDLLMSVMGAMDATSSHLLDKIPPTRTPSPVSVRDLHSPSPTPEPSLGDLLDVSDAKSSSQPTEYNQTEDLLSMGESNYAEVNQHFQNPLDIMDESFMPTMPEPDIQSQPVLAPEVASPPSLVQAAPTAAVQSVSPPAVQPVAQSAVPPAVPAAVSPAIPRQPYQPPVEKVVPPRPAPPPVPRPPRPQPPPPPQKPQKPPPPTQTYPSGITSPPTQSFQASQTNAQAPPVQRRPSNTPVNQPAANDNEVIDMFGTEEAQQPIQQKTISSTVDIMNLYNKQQVCQEPNVEVSQFNSMEENVQSSVIEEPITTTITDTSENLVTSSVDQVNSFVSTTFVQDSCISPEPSHSDMQMDTSDSQSKGSVSSVTFNPFSAPEETVSPLKGLSSAQPEVGPVLNFEQDTEFDAFAAKFESAGKDAGNNGAFDAFGGEQIPSTAWGTDAAGTADAFGGAGDACAGGGGFGNEEPFDSFLSMSQPPAVPHCTPNRLVKADTQDSDEEKDFAVFIRPKTDDSYHANDILPTLAPPPAAPVHTAFTDTSPRFNPFDQEMGSVAPTVGQEASIPYDEGKMVRSDSAETPPTPLFDDDVSQPLQPFPRIHYDGEGWEMQLRQPNKKKITGQRYWKKIFVKLCHQNDCVLLQLFNQKDDRDPFQELPLQHCYSVSEISAQQYDNYGKIFTVKLQYIFYKERPGVRPGQIKKAERITNKLSQFASYAIQGDYQGVKEFGSDLKKLGLPVEHAPSVTQLMKLGSLNYEDLKQFSVSIEEELFTLQAHRDRALHYKMEEVQITAVDELYVEQDAEGHIEMQIARVRLFFLGFLTGMPDIELGVNDMRRQGKEVVGRHDIIPVITEEWIRLENIEFHSCIQQDEYENSHIIRFKPPDACYIELMRFRVRPPKNRELPLQLKVNINKSGNKVVIKADVLVPGFASRKLGQVPCEDVMIRIPIPECWIYLFRTEKHFRYGSVKSTHRRTGKIKGIERFLGTVETLQESLIEVTSGQAKYEHQHRAIVWRCPRLPKEGQGAYTTHNLVCRMALTSYDQIPDSLAEHAYVEFTMPATQVSHMTVRSVSLQNSDSDDPPEKYVRYLARHEYRVGIEHTEGDAMAAYSAATFIRPAASPVKEETPTTIAENESSDDSD